MKIDLSKYNELVDAGFIRRVEKDGLYLYNYNDSCTYERHWNQYTLSARGLIVDKESNIVARPFNKFFNLGEHESTHILNLPAEPYEVTEKMDGSLGIIYYWNNKWNVATRGSFDSDQAVKATEMLSKYNFDTAHQDYTYLVEIIYPENKIVVNYGKEEKLVLLSIIHKDGREIPSDVREYFGKRLGMESAKSYNYTIQEMTQLQSKLSKDEEGFVIRFKSGLRVKIKGEEYLKIHKMISNMSPISFWESMVDGIVNRDYLAQLPEEFRNDFEPIVEQLEKQYATVKREIELDYNNLPTQSQTLEGRREIGLYLKRSNDIIHKSAMFPMLYSQFDIVNKYIMKYIRPDANELRKFE